MSEDIATLGLNVDYSLINQAAASLAAFGGAASEVDIQVNILKASYIQAGLSIEGYGAKLLIAKVAAGELTAAQAATSVGMKVATIATDENQAALTRLLVSIDPLIAAEQKHAANLVTIQALTASKTLTDEGEARAVALVNAAYAEQASRIEGTIQWVNKLKAAQEAGTTQTALNDAFGIGVASKSAKDSAAVFQEDLDVQKAYDAAYTEEAERETAALNAIYAEADAARLAELKATNDVVIAEMKLQQLENKELAKIAIEAQVALEAERVELGALGAQAQIAADKLFQLKVAQAGSNFQSDLNASFGIGSSARANGATTSAAASIFNTLPKEAEEAEVAVNKVTSAVNVNRMAMVEAGRVVKDLGDGNILYLAADSEQLLARLNLLTGSMLPLVLGIGAVVVAVGGLTYEMAQGEAQVTRFTNALTLTNHYADITSSQFTALAGDISTKFNVPIGQSIATLQNLTATGQFTGQTLTMMAENATIFGELTGQSSEKVIGQFEKMDQGVEKFALDWNDHYHDLSVAQLEHINLLEIEGQKAQAEQEVQSDLYNTLGTQGVAQLGLLEVAWRDLNVAISGALQTIRDFGKEQTLGMKVANDQAAIAADKNSVWQSLAPGLFGTDGQLKQDQAQLLVDQTKMLVAGGDGKGAAAQQNEAQTTALKAANSDFVNIKHNADDAAGAVAKFNKEFADATVAGGTTASDFMKAHNYFGDPSKFLSTEDDAIRHKFDAPRHTPMSQAQRFGVGTDQVNAEADQELQVAAAYIQSAAAGDRLTASVKAIKDATDKKLEGDERQQRISADENLEIDKQIANNDKRMAQSRQEEQIRAGVLTKEQDGLISSTQYNQQVSETIALLPFWTTLTAAQGDVQKKAAQDSFDAQKRVLDQDYWTKQTQGLVASNEATKNNLALLALKIQLQYTDATQAAEAIAMEQKRQELIKISPFLPDLPEGRAAIAGAGAAAGMNAQLSNKYTGSNIAQQTQDLTNAQQALNSAVAAGILNVEQYGVGLTHVKQLELDLAANKSGSWSDIMTASLHRLVDTGKTTTEQLTDNFSNFFSTMEDGFANSIGKAIVGAGDLKTSLIQAAQTGLGDLISGFVKLGEQWLINQILANTLMTSSNTASIANATAMGLAWAPVATSVSIASFGAADAAAAAAMAATYATGLALGAPKAEGGWVRGAGGPMSDSVLTPTSDGEFITRASVAQDPVNAHILEAMNNGKRFSTGYAAGGFVGGAPNVSNSSSSTTAIHFDFSNTVFAGSVTREDVEDIVNHSMTTVWAPGIVKQSVQTSLLAGNKLSQRQKLNQRTANRNF